MFSVKYIAFLIAAQPALAVQHHLGMGQRQKLGAALEVGKVKEQVATEQGAGDGAGATSAADDKKTSEKKGFFCTWLPFICPTTAAAAESGAASDFENCQPGNKFKYYKWFVWYRTIPVVEGQGAKQGADKCMGVDFKDIKEWVIKEPTKHVETSVDTSAKDESKDGGKEASEKPSQKDPLVVMSGNYLLSGNK